MSDDRQALPPAGWYPEGHGLRYWDGAAWTEHRAPASPSAPSISPTESSSPSGRLSSPASPSQEVPDSATRAAAIADRLMTRDWWTRPRLLVAGGVAAAAVVVSVVLAVTIGGDDLSDSPDYQDGYQVGYYSVGPDGGPDSGQTCEDLVGQEIVAGSVSNPNAWRTGCEDGADDYRSP